MFEKIWTGVISGVIGAVLFGLITALSQPILEGDLLKWVGGASQKEVNELSEKLKRFVTLEELEGFSEKLDRRVTRQEFLDLEERLDSDDLGIMSALFDLRIEHEETKKELEEIREQLRETATVNERLRRLGALRD